MFFLSSSWLDQLVATIPGSWKYTALISQLLDSLLQKGMVAWYALRSPCYCKTVIL